MTIAEQIYALVRALPEERAAEILTFAEFVQAKYAGSGKALSSPPMAWADLVSSLSGAWEEDFPTLEEIRAGSGEDVPRESL